MKNPFLEAPAEEAPVAPDVAGLFPVETPLGVEADDAAEEAEPEGILPAPPGKKGADYSQNPAWKRIVSARDAAVAELTPLKQRVAELEPIAQAVRDRFKGRGDNPVAAMEWDATFADTFERLLEQDPEVQSVARKVAAAMSGTTPTPTTPPAAKPAPAAPASDPRLDLILQRDAQREVEATLREMGIVDGKVPGMAKFIVQNSSDLTAIAEADITALGRRYVKEHGLTPAELTGKPENGSAPRRPSTAGSRGAPRAEVAAAEADEKPEPEFKDLKGYRAFKEKMIRAFPTS